MVYLCIITLNRLDELKYTLSQTLPFIDRVIIVEGASHDSSFLFLKNWAKHEPKIQLILSPWEDNFSRQRNKYLREVPEGNWVLTIDSDECLTNEALATLRDTIKKAERDGFDMVAYQSRSIDMEGPVKIDSRDENHHKPILFKKNKSCRYKGNPHEHLDNHSHLTMKSGYFYEHIRQVDSNIFHGARNLFINGGGYNISSGNPRWVKLREICSSIGINNWHSFDLYLMKGNIDPRLKELICSFKDLDGWDGASEHREMYKLYYTIYHPEEA